MSEFDQMEVPTEKQEQVPAQVDSAALRKEYEAKWEAFRKDAFDLAQKHGLAGLFCAGAYVKADAESRVQAVPTYSSTVMPSINSAEFLFSMRDSVLDLMKNSANQAIEATLRQMDASKNATQPPAEA